MRSAPSARSRATVDSRVAATSGWPAPRRAGRSGRTGRPGHRSCRPRSSPARGSTDDDAAGHVLAAVRADALDDRLRAAVADREAHPGPPDEVQPTAGRPVQDGVAGDRLAGGGPARSGSGRSTSGRRTGPCRRSRWPGRPAAARRPAPVNAPNDWPGRAAQLEADRAAQLAALERAGEPGPERPVGRRQPQAGREPGPGPRNAPRPGPRAARPARGGRSGRPAGSARRAARVPRGGADDRRRAPRGGGGRSAAGRLSPTTSPTDRAPTAASSRGGPRRARGRSARPSRACR